MTYRSDAYQSIEADSEFDADWYVAQFPDVAMTAMSPAEHWIRIGARLGRPRRADEKDSALSVANGVPLPTVDIIVPVFNALSDARKCLYSIAWHRSSHPIHLIIIDDGSDNRTRDWLKDFCESSHSEGFCVTLIRKEENEGYTRAINSGLSISTGSYVITQNSDTVVPSRWIEKMIACMQSDPNAGIVGPLSNAASWQNVPELRDEDGGFAINRLPRDLSVEGMSRLVEEASKKSYPSVSFVNGFCFMISRALIEKIGHLDEKNFPVGYGEENDYCIRAANAGFKLLIADDAFVFHAKSKSFGHSSRAELSKQGDINLRAKHGHDRVNQLINKIKNDQELSSCRDQFKNALNGHNFGKSERRLSWLLGQRILFVLPVGGGGGGSHSIVQEATEMRELGVHVQIAVTQGQVNQYLTLYADVPNVENLFVPFTTALLPQLLSIYDVVVATIFSSVGLIKRCLPKGSKVTIAYYAQDYEPLFFEAESSRYKEAVDSYTLIPDALVFAKTDWICDQIATLQATDCKRVMASLDHGVYYPDPKRLTMSHNVTRITAMLRPSSPYRGSDRTVRIMARLKERYSEDVCISFFGSAAEDPFFVDIQNQFEFENYGILRRNEVADLIRNTDILLDLSDYQAFGRTGIESMACGCAVVSTMHGGVKEYIRDGVNALLVDPFNEQAVFETVCRVIDDSELRATLQIEAIQTAATYNPRIAALSELDLFARQLSEKVPRQNPASRTRVCVIPAVSTESLDRVSYTGSAFVRLINPYFSLEGTDVAITFSANGRLPKPGSSDVAIFQRDLGSSGQRSFTAWASEWRASGGCIVYDIDDDLLDGPALKQRGFAGDVNELAARVKNYCAMADIIVASTSRLAKVLAEYQHKVIVVPNYIDADLWRLHEPKNHIESSKIKIGYFGTPTHDDDLKLIADSVRRIEAEFGVEVEVIGAFQNSEPLFGRRIGLPKSSIYPVFSDWILKVSNWDIVVIPLAESSFNRSKSNLKFVESSALGAAIVCSKTEEYCKLARNGHNSLVVDNTSTAWYEALRDLVLNPELRQRLAKNARRDLIAKWTVQANRELYLSVIRQALDSRAGATAAKHPEAI